MKNVTFLIIVLFIFSSCAKENLESLNPSIEEITLSTDEQTALKQQQTESNSFQLVLPNVGDKLYVQTFSNTTGGNSFVYFTVQDVKCVKNSFIITATTFSKTITINGKKDIMSKINVDDCSTNATYIFYTYVFDAKLTSTNNYFYDGFYNTKPKFGCGASGIYDPVNCPQSCWTTPKLVASETSNTNMMYINW